MITTDSRELPNNLRVTFLSNRLAKLAELLLVFFAAFFFIKLMSPLAGSNPVLKQAIVWVANIIMLTIVWIGLKLRGENWNNFGLGLKLISWKEGLKIFMLSLLVFVLAIAGFIVGSIIMANITGIPEGAADMSGYDYMKDNLGMFLLTLFGVLIVSSFGEEVIYRAFLINRLSELGFGGKSGRIITVIISSVIFGLAHYEWGAMGIVQTGFMGLALGICYIKMKRRLWILIIAHAYMDIILMVQMYLNIN